MLIGIFFLVTFFLFCFLFAFWMCILFPYIYVYISFAGWKNMWKSLFHPRKKRLSRSSSQSTRKNTIAPSWREIDPFWPVGAPVCPRSRRPSYCICFCLHVRSLWFACSFVVPRNCPIESVSTLRNITMELRKVCNHPYMMTGAEFQLIEAMQKVFLLFFNTKKKNLVIFSFS